MTESVRVRFAPSPTGYLHIGNARTALFNYLFARQHRGHLVLRIEDTDVTRSTQKFETAILDDLKWLAIRWQEGPDIGGGYGPYRQSGRLERYLNHANQLSQRGKAYKCFCSPEDLEQMRKALLAKGQMPRYAGRCRNLSPQTIERLEKEGRKSTLRFKVDSGIIRFRDLIHGPLSFDRSHIGDFVLLRSDRTPAYNFACVVDDASMRITHVIRGDDHLPNTPRQLLLYEHLGFAPPQFAHHPLILGADRTPLSKRHGVTSVRNYRDEGYLSEALNNTLALLGWTPEEKGEILSLEDLVRTFRLEKVAKSAPVFDRKKLDWINGQHIKRMDPESLHKKIAPFIPAEMSMDERKLKGIVTLLRDNLQTLKQIREYIGIFTDCPLDMDSSAVEALKSPEAVKVLSEMRSLLMSGPPLAEETATQFMENLRLRVGVHGKPMMMPIRAAITGKTHGPELVRILTSIEGKTILQRLDRALEQIEKP